MSPIPTLGQPGFGMDFKDRFRGAFVNNPQIVNYPTPTSSSTANVTVTSAQLIGGIITVGGASTGGTATLPSAATLRGALAPYCDLQGVQIGDSIPTLIINASGSNLWFALGSGGSFDTNGNQLIPSQGSKYILIRFTAVVPGSETYTLYA